METNINITKTINLKKTEILPDSAMDKIQKLMGTKWSYSCLKTIYRLKMSTIVFEICAACPKYVGLGYNVSVVIESAI